MKNSVGVLGGIGPLATVYFMDLIIRMTEAETDQEHINMLVSNHATIPDRTDYIMGKSSISPLDDMTEDAKMLEKAGCRFIVIPCNTAHYFFEDIEKSVKIPVLNIIKETILYAADKCRDKDRKEWQGKKEKDTRQASEYSECVRLGILATEGTISSETYSYYGKEENVCCIAPDEEYQKKVNHIIYGCVKAGLSADEKEVDEVIEHMRNKGCDAVIMGCTELSVVYGDMHLDRKYDFVVDSLKVLAMKTVTKCGKTLRSASFTHGAALDMDMM